MPQFAPGVAKTAIAPIVAKPSGMNCEAELFLGPDDATKIVSSGRVPFVSTGAAKNVNLPITMPGSPGSYHGYIDVFAGGLRFLAYRLTEDVIIAQPQYAFNFGTPSGALYNAIGLGYGWRLARITCQMSNPNTSPVTRNIRVLWQDVAALGWHTNRVWSYGGSAWFPVTLSPGAVQTLVQMEQFTIPGVDPNQGGTSWNQPAYPSSGWAAEFVLEDDLGNKSPGVTISV